MTSPRGNERGCAKWCGSAACRRIARCIAQTASLPSTCSSRIRAALWAISFGPCSMNSGTRRFIGTVNFRARWSDSPLSCASASPTVSCRARLRPNCWSSSSSSTPSGPPRASSCCAKSKSLPAPGPDTPCRIHPLARLVRFHHDPDALLDAAARGVIASAKIPRRESLLALSLVDGEVRVIQLPDDIRRALDDDG